ncbi:MAG: DNA alkylation repair protein [bacterium]
MNCTEVLAWLAERGNPQTVKTLARHGITDPANGNTYPDIDKLSKKLGTDHALALELWKSGVHEARVIATRIAEPESLTKAQIVAWQKSISDHAVGDVFAGLIARRADALGFARDWIDSPDERKSSNGWSILTYLARTERLPKETAAPLIGRIATNIHGAKNRTRYAMNNTLISIGGYIPALRPEALRAAKAIGKVIVDHGETGCKTPDATAYIAKMAARVEGKKKPVGLFAFKQ